MGISEYINPMVSVIVPNFNHGRFLRERLESIINQTYKNIELIILDDCSTDDSLGVIDSVVSEIQDSLMTIQVIVNDSNSGSPFKQWRKGIEASQGEYIWIAESDDYCSELFVEKTMREIIEKKLDLCFCQSQLVNADGHFLYIYNDDADFYKKDKVFGFSDVSETIAKDCLIPNASAVIFRKDKALPFMDDIIKFRYCSDWLLWTNIICQSERCGYLSTPYNYYRRHGETTTSVGQTNMLRYFSEQVKVISLMPRKAISRKSLIYWIELWLEFNHNRFVNLLRKESRDVLKSFYNISIASPFLLVAYCISHRTRNAWIKVSKTLTK